MVDVEREARARFGFAALRAGQGEAVRSVLSGTDTLVVMPTGAGKSLIYQLAGALLDGPTVVVSPLIALQRDQVLAIGGHRLGDAVELNSAMSPAQRAEVLRRVAAREVAFVFLAPEQLANADTIACLRAARPPLVTVDEAHCIASWGHDFRPDYLRIRRVVDDLGHPTVLALTATASPPVRRQIVDHLGMRGHREVIRGFGRPNLRLEVEAHPEGEAHVEAIRARVAATPGTGLVYVASRKQADELAALLDTPERPARAYHAGLGHRRRDEIHRRFADPRPSVVVATIAFGMGVDAPHVRFVFHADPPESVDAYYQEVGRAGRDGAPALAVLFRRLGDDGGRRFYAGAASIPVDLLETLATAVQQACEPVPIALLSAITQLTESRLIVALSRLQQAGAVDVTADGSVSAAPGAPPPPVAAAAAARDHEEFRIAERSRLEMMRRFVSTPGCRWRFVLQYFGEGGAEPCGHCDHCDGMGAARFEVSVARPFPERTLVRHTTWGVGEVLGYQGDLMTVLFDGVGYRTLSSEVVVGRQLLEPA
jgi:ATP-dependent DNA helicase RecQ